MIDEITEGEDNKGNAFITISDSEDADDILSMSLSPNKRLRISAYGSTGNYSQLYFVDLDGMIALKNFLSKCINELS